MKRGTVTKKEARLLTAWVPTPMFAAVDDAVRAEDTDRSKFVRSAIKEKLARMTPASLVS